jgi:hypothetical protein
MKKVLALVLALVTLVSFPAASVKAEVANPVMDCSSYYVAFYEHHDGGQSWVICPYYNSPVFAIRKINTPSWFNDKASRLCLDFDVNNNDTMNVKYFTHENQVQHLRTRSIRKAEGFKCWNFEHWENDRVSSIYISFTRLA